MLKIIGAGTANPDKAGVNPAHPLHFLFMLSDKEIQHIADLARIELTDKEKEKFKKDLSSILDYINQLNQADTSQAEPLYQTTGLVNSVRPDKHQGDFRIDEKLNDLLIDQAPDKKENFIKVKSILNAK